MFDAPNILLKLQVDCVNILRDIVIFIYGPFGLKLPIHSHFGEFWGIQLEFPLELGTGARGQTRSSADADNRLDAFSSQSRSTNMLPFHMLHIVSYCAIVTLSLRQSFYDIRLQKIS